MGEAGRWRVSGSDRGRATTPVLPSNIQTARTVQTEPATGAPPGNLLSRTSTNVVFKVTFATILYDLLAS